ncbi:MAG: DUF3298 domain-containing protein [Acetatifactor sp.]
MNRKRSVRVSRIACISAAVLLGLTACGTKEDDTQSEQTEEAERVSKGDKKKKDKESKQESQGGEESSSTEREDGREDAEKDAGEKKPENAEKVLPIEIYKQNVYDSCWEEVNLAEMSYDLIYLSEDAAALLPELENALTAWNVSVRDGMTATYENYKIAAKEDCKYNPDYFFGPYSTEQEVSVLRSDNRVLSLGIFSYDYCGGAHGYYAYTGYTVDAVSGRELTIGDVVTDTDKLPELLYERLTTENPEVYFWEDMKDYLEEAFTEADTTLAWSLDYTGLTFYFNPYEIASYADGRFDVTFDFRGYAELFRPYYTEVPDSYVVSSDVYDLDQDGELDTFYVSAWESDYGDYEKIYIGINENTLEREVWALGMDDYLVHTKDAGNFLYVELTRENDYKTLEVYDMNGDAPVYVGCIDNVGLEEVCIGEEQYAKVLLTNPDLFRLRSKMDIMSTYGGYKDYRVGGDGIPVSDDRLYHASYCGVPDWSVLSAKQDVTGVLVDKDGRETGKEYTIPSGTEVTICATDGESFVDFEAGNERVRVYVSCESWPQTIGGIDIEELFDGIMFAG